MQAREAVERVLDAIAGAEPGLNAVVTVDADRARREADALDAGGPGRGGPLYGVAMTVKDAFATAGMRTTAGMTSRRDHVPSADAVAVARLRAAGAVIVGKTNVPDGISGQETANELFGRTVNPWSVDRTPGGSSGGAAAALAAGIVPLELGSDSGGSIRQPAHCCGVYGHVPTHGLVPQRGHLPSAPVDDVGVLADMFAVGPMATSPTLLGVALGVLVGADELGVPVSSLSLAPPPAPQPGGRWRIGLCVDSPACPVSSDVRTALDAAADELRRAGCIVELVDPPPVEAFDDAFVLWVAAQASPGDRPPAVGGALAELVTRGRTLTHAEWLDLDRRRRAQQRAWDATFDAWDVLLCPIAPTTAPAHDARPADVDELDHRLARTIDVDGRPRPYLDQVRWNVLTNAAGLPATAVPAGVGRDGLPIGGQLVGRHGADRWTLALAVSAFAAFDAPNRGA